jgi:NitT/TauT family transport system substrate-binding protein
MSPQHAQRLSRRRFLGELTLVGTAGLLGLRPGRGAAEPPPETTAIRWVRSPAICVAPYYIAEALLHGEGFTEVHPFQTEGQLWTQAVLSGDVDLVLNFVGPLLVRLDAGDPLVILAGVHVGCFELFGTERVRAIRDLKGKTVSVPELGSPQHVFLASIAAHVGLDPRKDINWVIHPRAEAMQLLADGKVDAFLGFPPEPQALRAKGIGHVVVNSALDRPWSQYFCCMVYARRDFAQQYPVATKRALRAILKAADICALEPDRAAQFLVDQGYTARYDYARQAMQELPYGKWREYDHEDTVRFYALRLHEAGLIKSTPQKIITQSTDWRFLNELKKELKG